MRLFIGVIAYLIGSAALFAGAAALVVVLAAPVVTHVLAHPDSKTVAPRIQMWLDRNAEAIVYAERAKAAALAEEEKWKALAMRIRIPTAADYAAFAKARAQDQRALQQEVSAKMRESARRKAQPGQLHDAQQASQAVGYYPDLHARIY